LGENGDVRVTAKADYAVRAAIELAAAGEGPVKGDRIADAQHIPLRFLENILGELKHAGLVRSQRGQEGGYWLNRPADEITLAEIIRIVEGPLVGVRGQRPDEVAYDGTGGDTLQRVWVALRANIREVLESVTLADVVAGELPQLVLDLTQRPEVWQQH
jgi:Rrf2 family protein